MIASVPIFMSQHPTPLVTLAPSLDKYSPMAIPLDADIQELTRMNLFEGFSRDQISTSIRGSIIKTLKHRQVLYTAGDIADRFGVIMSGAIKLVRPTPRGDDIIVHFGTPGDVVGALVMNQSQGAYPITAKSMGPSKVICIPRTTYDTYWAKNALFQNRLNSLLYKRMSLIQEDKTLFKAPLQQRIATLLINLLNRSDAKSNLNSETPQENHILSIPLTRQEIADSLGVAVESVIRIMSEWNHKGLIRSNEKQLEIIGLDQLINIMNQL